MRAERLELDASPSRWLTEHAEGLIAFRRTLHANPELSGMETATTELIGERLRLAGLHPRILRMGTGLICDVGHDTAGAPRLAFRADLDALAMDDEKLVSYRSANPGVAHACGHDVHTAVMLGTALYFAHSSGLLPGPLRFIFQPAEESLRGGATDAIDDGAIDGVGAILGIHVDPKLRVGRVGVKAGAISSAADMATITLTGPGGHTARPDETVDMVSVVARLVSELPGRVAGRVGDPDAVRTAFGMVQAGDAANVIPTRATLRASVRSPSVPVWERLPSVFEAVVAEVLAGTGAHHSIEYVHGVPPVVNDGPLTDMVAAAAARELGHEAVTPAHQSWGGDDFAWYGRHVPASYTRVGAAGGSGRPLELHTGLFDVDESAIAVAIRVLVATTVAYFSRRNTSSD
jgi:amidohydrolase